MCTNAIRFPAKALSCAEDVAAESGDAFLDDVLGTRWLLVEVDAVEGEALRIRPVLRFKSESFLAATPELLGDGAGATRLTADTSTTPDDTATSAGRSVLAGLEHADAVRRIDSVNALRIVKVLHQ